MVDIHSHILPNIDDGAQNFETSVKILQEQFKQGVSIVVATPHFYPATDTVDRFVKKRQLAFEALNEYIEKNNIINIPQILLGAEIHFSSDIQKTGDLRPLLINNTDFALLELPYNFSGSWVVNSIFEMSAKYRFTPILAHIERYVAKAKNYDHFNDLFDMNIYFQINADSINSFKYKRIINKLVREYKVHFIASDAHNMDSRPVLLNNAISYLGKKFGNDFIDFIDNNSHELINNSLNLF